MSIYEITTKYTQPSGTIRNHRTYCTIAHNMNEAIKKTETYLKKRNAGAERIDEVRFMVEIDF